jgi:hypothetical protein
MTTPTAGYRSARPGKKAAAEPGNVSAPADKATCRSTGDARTEETRSAADQQTGS